MNKSDTLIKPVISVIMTTYNRLEKLKRAIESVKKQTFDSWELIIIDDKSDDGTFEYVASLALKDYRIRQISLLNHKGKDAYSKNRGIKEAKGDYIAFLDDDDVYSKHALRKLHRKISFDFEAERLDVVYGGYLVVDDGLDGEGKGIIYEFSQELIEKKNFIVTCSVLIKKKALLSVNGFDESIRRFPDWNLWIRMARNGSRFGSIQDTVSKVLINHPDQVKKPQIYEDKEGNIVSTPYFDLNDMGLIPIESYLNPKKENGDMLVSIIIPVFNRPDLTKVCIDSIINYTTFPYELVLVQEGENEEIETLLRSYGCLYKKNPKPKGFAGAMNTGYTIANGTHYCFLNNDVVVIPNWLTYMMDAFIQNPKVGLATPTYTETSTKQSIDFNDGDAITYVDDPLNLKGVCFLVSKGAFDKAGGWDESYGRGGGEDNDLSLKIKKAGYKLVIARRSFIYHYGSAAFREVFDNDIPFSKKYSSKQFNKVRKKWKFDKGPRVLAGIPTVKGFVWHTLLLRMVQWSHSTNYKFGFKIFPYLVPHDNARNSIVKDYLEDFWDYLVMIDDDMDPPPNTIDALLEADKDIIGPTCLTLKTDNKGMVFPIPVANRYDENRQYRPYYGTGVEETDTISGGMFMVKREVYEQIERPFHFTYHKDGTVEYSEDFVFAQQCQALGYKLYTHFGVICEHMKTVGVKTFSDALVVTSEQAMMGSQDINIPTEEYERRVKKLKQVA